MKNKIKITVSILDVVVAILIVGWMPIPPIAKAVCVLLAIICVLTLWIGGNDE